MGGARATEAKADDILLEEEGDQAPTGTDMETNGIESGSDGEIVESASTNDAMAGDEGTEPNVDGETDGEAS